jgi:hypothetical protein
MSLEERLAANVVTSENLAEFTAQKLGLAEPQQAEPAASEEQAPDEPDTAAGQSGQDGEGDDATAADEQGKERKPNPKIERRFSEITKQREAAKAEAQQEREARLALEARLKELEAKANPQPAQAQANELGPEPQPEQFSDMFEYAKALAEYTADKKLMEREQQEVQRKAAAEQELKFKAWSERISKAKAELPDFDEMVQSSEVSVSDPVRDAIMESDVGPKILYHLAENPEFATKLNGMSVISALREIGKLEARLEKPATSTERAPTGTTVVGKSRAPAPITPIRGGATGKETGVDSNGEFHGSFQAWKAARLAGKIR